MGRKDKLVQDKDALQIGARMRLARQRQAISLKEMAKRVEYTVPYLSAVENGKVQPSYALVEIYEHILEPDQGTLVRFFEASNAVVPGPPKFDLGKEQTREDWGEAPDIRDFYGREQEQEQLAKMMGTCRIVAIVGLGGVGKTSLAAKIAKQIKTEFDFVFWRSLENMPSLEHILKRCISFLSQHQQQDLPNDEDDLLLLFMHYLSTYRCLFVLDNFESILQEGQDAGQNRERRRGFAKLLKLIGETSHKSCFLMTSREKPSEMALLEGPSGTAYVLSLSGVEDREAREILKGIGLTGDHPQWSTLNKLYSGNPLSLKLVAASILEMFEGDIGKFLSQEATVFGGIYDLLNKQIQRLSIQEHEILYWLAIEQIAVSLEDLRKNVVYQIPVNSLLAALDSLKRRFLIIRVEAERFSLHPVVKEFITNDFIEQMASIILEELTENMPLNDFFDRYPLMKVQSKDHVRNAQKRLILDPLVNRLRATIGQEQSGAKLKSILSLLRRRPQFNGYAAGNVLNLLIHLKVDLRKCDFSKLVVREAYLRGVNLPEVNFYNADFSTAVFTETFGSILSITIDKEGQYLAAGTVTGEIRTWHLTNHIPALTLQGHTNWVWSVVFSPNGELLASGSDDRTVCLWDVSNGQCLAILGRHLDRVRSVAFSPDGKLLASGSEDGTIKVWDVAKRRCLKVLDAKSRDIYAVAFSPDGRLLAGGSESGTIVVWEVESYRSLPDFTLEVGHIYAVAFSPDGRLLAGGSENGTIAVWEVAGRRILPNLEWQGGEVYTLAFSPGGKLLASGYENGTVILWDVQTMRIHHALREHSNRVYSVAFSPKSQLLGSGSNDQTVRLWDLKTEQCLETLQGYTNLVWSVTFSPDGQILATGSNDRMVRLWDRQSEQCLKILEGHSDLVRAVTFHPGGKLLASGAEDKTVRLWDSETGHCLQILEGHTDRVRAVAFHPEGKLLASGAEDGLVILWKMSTGQRFTTYDGEGGQVYAVAFSPDGHLLASGSEDGFVRIWGMDEKLYETLPVRHDDKIYALAFSPDGKLLASGSNDQTIKLWNIETKENLATLSGHENRIFSLAFSPDGELLASGSNDQTIKLWNIHTYKCEDTLKGEDLWVYSIAFDPNGHILASGGNEGTIVLWSVAERKRLAKPLMSERPYEGMNIMKAKGLSPSRYSMLLALGAIEKDMPEE